MKNIKLEDEEYLLLKMKARKKGFKTPEAFLSALVREK
tara:strand:+ start:290 stop:403 length:114 start_codon:yes stop_codon:yes gene_type:complete